jgi:uncharacterized protein (DUF427 family)
VATRVRDLLTNELDELRFEPSDKRIRAQIAGRTVVDSKRAMLVWEPKRVVPSYAIPVADIDAEVIALAADRPPASDADADALTVPQLGGRPVYDPSIPFSVHTTDGTSLDLRSSGLERRQAAFRPADDALSGYLILDFKAFDGWYEEDELNVAHPRDPFHRIDIVHSSRDIRVQRDGQTLARSSSPYILFEPPLPVRYYLPPGDVDRDLLAASDTTTYCAYKGQASYLSVDGEDVAWTYRKPLREAVEVTDRIAFFNERVDLVVDGVALQRPVTPWSPR